MMVIVMVLLLMMIRIMTVIVMMLLLMMRMMHRITTMILMVRIRYERTRQRPCSRLHFSEACGLKVDVKADAQARQTGLVTEMS